MNDIPFFWRPARWALAGYLVAAAPFVHLLQTHWNVATRYDWMIAILFPCLWPALVGIALLSMRLLTVTVGLTFAINILAMIYLLNGMSVVAEAEGDARALMLQVGSFFLVSFSLWFVVGGWGWWRFFRSYRFGDECLFGHTFDWSDWPPPFEDKKGQCRAFRYRPLVAPKRGKRIPFDEMELTYIRPVRWALYSYVIVFVMFLVILFTDHVRPRPSELLVAVLAPLAVSVSFGFVMLPVKLLEMMTPVILISFGIKQLAIYVILACLPEVMKIPDLGMTMLYLPMGVFAAMGIGGWMRYFRRRLPDGRLLIGFQRKRKVTESLSAAKAPFSQLGE